ncbi:MAG: lipoprotein insertase outer membrane protein LolB [Pseudomonadota bacterium]
MAMLIARIRSFFHSPRKNALVIALPLFIGGCATVIPPAGPEAAPSIAQQRSYQDVIDLGGRLSLRYQRNGNDEAVHGSFTWTQTPRHTLVTLLSPLGQTIATIAITPTQSTLTRAGEAPQTAMDVDALAARALGWPLPISGLRDWLQGFAIDANGSRFIATPQSRDASVTTGDGWRIRYGSWKNEHDLSAQNHPKRIDLERSTAQAGDVSLRMVIDQWQPR